jgi:hypothetical protein
MIVVALICSPADAPDLAFTSPSGGSRMPTWTDDAPYWHLVQELMHLGWYRVGPGPDYDPDRKTWGFGEGHLTDAHRRQLLWIPARDETTAMRILRDTMRSPSLHPPA